MKHKMLNYCYAVCIGFPSFGYDTTPCLKAGFKPCTGNGCFCSMHGKRIIAELSPVIFWPLGLLIEH